MDNTGKQFRTWVLKQRVCGTQPEAIDANHLHICTSNARAEVNFYPNDDGREIVEYRISRESDGKPFFFLHAMLDRVARAQELFEQMVEALVEDGEHTTTRVLLCCTSGLTTTMFASKMTEVAQALSLDYEFTAMSVDRALAARNGYSAVLLAPQVAHMRSQLVEAHPQAVVFEIPGKIFGSYDAAAAVHLLMHAFHELHEPDLSKPYINLGNRMGSVGRILVITLFVLRSSSRMGYKIFDKGSVIDEGTVRKPRLDYRDVEDLIETLGARGLELSTLDAVGIAVPGVAYRGVVSLPGYIEGRYDLASHIRRRFGLRVFVDNNCNAAAVGCYVGQSSYESLVFYRHELGHPAGGMGTLIDGRLLKGRMNLAGEPKYYEQKFQLGAHYEDAIWSARGLFEISANIAASAIALLSPDAVYLAVDTVDDMIALRNRLAETFPEELIPPLHVVNDYVEKVYMGELSLCLQKLLNPNYRSLGITH